MCGSHGISVTIWKEREKIIIIIIIIIIIK